MNNSGMGVLSVRWQLNHLGLAQQVQELVSNCLIVSGRVTLVFAPEKQRKTYLLIQAALCAALGESLGQLSFKRGKVLFITFEGGKPYLLTRLEELAQALYPIRADEALGNIGVEDLKGAALDKSVVKIQNLAGKYKPLYIFLDPVDLALSEDFSSPKVAKNCMTNLIHLAENYSCGLKAKGLKSEVRTRTEPSKPEDKAKGTVEAKSTETKRKGWGNQAPPILSSLR